MLAVGISEDQFAYGAVFSSLRNMGNKLLSLPVFFEKVAEFLNYWSVHIKARFSV